MKKKEVEEVRVRPIDLRTIVVNIIGETGLICNRRTPEAVAMKSPGKAKKAVPTSEEQYEKLEKEIRPYTSAPITAMQLQVENGSEIASKKIGVFCAIAATSWE